MHTDFHRLVCLIGVHKDECVHVCEDTESSINACDINQIS